MAKSNLPQVVSDSKGFVLRIDQRAYNLIGYDPAFCIRLTRQEIEKLFLDIKELLKK